MAYALTTSHTFNANDMEARRFRTPQDAWDAAASDYARTDAGFNPSVGVQLLIDMRGTGACHLPEGETIAVVEVP